MRSRGEALERPAAVLAAVAQAVVQAAAAPLPELELLRLEQVAAPVLRPRHRAAREALLGLGDAMVQVGARADDLALRRGPRRDLAAARARGEVRVALGRIEAPDRPARADGAVLLEPAPRQRRDAPAVEVARLGAAVAREEAKAARVDAAQQDVAAARAAVGVDGRERRRVRLVDPLGGGVLEPAAE